MEKAVMTTREVAEFVGIPEGEVRRLAREGVLKPLRGFRKPKKFSRHVVTMWLRGEEPERRKRRSMF